MSNNIFDCSKLNNSTENGTIKKIVEETLVANDRPETIAHFNTKDAVLIFLSTNNNE